MGEAGDTGAGRTVVVVEDNPRSRRLVCDLLTMGGFEVVEADTGEAGIDAVQRVQPDLVLLDIQLPGVDGEAVLRAIRAQPAVAQTPIVAVTAYAMRGDEERLLAAGFDAYLAKPIDTRTFVARLAAVIDGAPQPG